MAEQDRFSEEEWRSLIAGPGAAFTAVVAADHAGVIAMIKEARALEKASKAAHKEGDWPDVVAEMMAYLDQHRDQWASQSPAAEDYDGSYEAAMERLSAAGAVAGKLTPDELDGYVRWVLGLATSTAEAVTEKGSPTPISGPEREALAEMERRLRQG